MEIQPHALLEVPTLITNLGGAAAPEQGPTSAASASCVSLPPASDPQGGKGLTHGGRPGVGTLWQSPMQAQGKDAVARLGHRGAALQRPSDRQEPQPWLRKIPPGAWDAARVLGGVGMGPGLALLLEKWEGERKAGQALTDLHTERQGDHQQLSVTALQEPC